MSHRLKGTSRTAGFVGEEHQQRRKDGLNNSKEIVAEYQYDESGNRLSVTDEAGNSTHYSYDAAGNIIATYDKISGQNATLQQIPVYAMGRIGTYDGNVYSYEVSDHLGNVRQAWTEAQLNSGTASNPSKANYYPYGLEWQASSLASYPYGYQGQFSEKDNHATVKATDDTPLSTQQSFDLRDYNAITGLWDVVDPYNQYYSSYIGMGNNPVSGTDPDGGKTFLSNTKVGIWFNKNILRHKVSGNPNIRSTQGHNAYTKPTARTPKNKLGTIKFKNSKLLKNLVTITPEIVTDDRPNLPDDVPKRQDVNIKFNESSDRFEDGIDATEKLKPIVDLMNKYPEIKVTIITNVAVEENDSTDPNSEVFLYDKSVTANKLMESRAEFIKGHLNRYFDIDPNRIKVSPGNVIRGKIGLKSTIIFEP